MNKFSQREGYLPVPEPLKLEELSLGFRREIELCLVKALELYRDEERYAMGRKKVAANWEEILRDIWVEFLDQPLNLYQGIYYVQEGLLRIIHYGEFYEVFDVVEELVNRVAIDQPKFYEDLKKIFERRRVAYRLIGSNPVGFAIVPTTSDLEAITINDSFDCLSLRTPKYDLVLKHLLKSAQFLREGDDGKSVGEAASALEAFFRITANSDKEYSFVLKESLKSISLHPIIKNRIDMAYQVASDISDGRHSAKQAGYAADRFDAQYIFTHCCFDIQYLINKQEVKSQGQEQF